MKGNLIGEGNTAEVYFWGENEILKLFKQKFPCEGVDKEYQVSKSVELLGLPVPKVGRMIELEGRKGIIYERITGTSLLDLIMKNPVAVANYTKLMAELHYKMHQCNATELPKYKEALEWNIRHTDLLKEEQRLAILDRLEHLPEGDVLCHGDFHPGNIITEMDRSVILDWMTATSGNPVADVARTVLLLKDAAIPENIPLVFKLLISLARKRMATSYLKRYLQLSGITKEDIDAWRLPIMAARLTEWIPESEEKFLLKEINKAIYNKKSDKKANKMRN